MWTWIINLIMTNQAVFISVGTAAILWIFKMIPNDIIYNAVFGLFKGIGIAMTLGLSKFQWTAPFWQKYIEPWFIDIINNTLGAAANGWVSGLQSDNTEAEEAIKPFPSQPQIDAVATANLSCVEQP